MCIAAVIHYAVVITTKILSAVKKGQTTIALNLAPFCDSIHHYSMNWAAFYLVLSKLFFMLMPECVRHSHILMPEYDVYVSCHSLPYSTRTTVAAKI